MPHQELTWDSQITHEEFQFILAPEGDYDFEVIHMEKERHQGSDNLPPCPMAVVHIRIQTDGGPVTIKHRLFLHQKTEGLLADFFVGIGQMKKGGTGRMNWNAVVGSKGRCRVIVRTWTGSDGEERQSNDIRRFYEPEDKPVAGAPSYQAGSF